MAIRRTDPWAIGAYMLWVVVLCLGISPDSTFQVLRDMSGVVTSTAWVNNSFLLVILLAGFIGFFAWQRALEARAHPATAQAVAIQLTLCALVAFIPVSPIDFILVLERSTMDIGIVWAMGGAKGLCWLYLLGLFFRYYVLHSYGVFGRMQSLFPSGRNAPPSDQVGYEKSAALYDSTGD